MFFEKKTADSKFQIAKNAAESKFQIAKNAAESKFQLRKNLLDISLIRVFSLSLQCRFF